MKYRITGLDGMTVIVEADSFRRTDGTYIFVDNKDKRVAQVEASAVLGVFEEPKQPALAGRA